MNTDEVENLFKRIATDNGLLLRKNSDGSLTMLGGGFAIWILFQVERERGLFVTFGEDPPSDHRFPYGYGIDYLIRYKTGTDTFSSDSRDVAGAARLIETYCLKYLKGDASDYADFEKFAIGKIREMATPFPEFRANRLIRPEWT